MVVGSFALTALNVVGTVSFVTVGTFGAGMLAYGAENWITGNKNANWNDAFKQGALTMVQGVLNFALGAALGGAGYWDSLKPGNGLSGYIGSAKDFFLMETGKAGIGSYISGTISYLSVNVVPMAIRSFIRQIFTFPWNLIKP